MSDLLRIENGDIKGGLSEEEIAKVQAGLKRLSEIGGMVNMPTVRGEREGEYTIEERDGMRAIVVRR